MELHLVSITPSLKDMRVFLQSIWIIVCVDEVLQSANVISTMSENGSKLCLLFESAR